MITLLIVLHVIVCLFLVIIVLLQHGKGADIGATFGGSSQTLFGTEGPVPMLNKITTAAAVVFMLTSVTLAYFSSHVSTHSVMEGLKTPAAKVEKTVEKKDAVVPAPGEKQTPQATAPAAESKTVVPEQTKKN
jgi:preprotein translocase subunit SecG